LILLWTFPVGEGQVRKQGRRFQEGCRIAMPIFEYACAKCGHVFEKIVFGKATDSPPCPNCGSSGAEQKFSTFASVSSGSQSSRGACLPSGGG
jgi:putative FmdB family regulatory protein